MRAVAHVETRRQLLRGEAAEPAAVTCSLTWTTMILASDKDRESGTTIATETGTGTEMLEEIGTTVAVGVVLASDGMTEVVEDTTADRVMTTIGGETTITAAKVGIAMIGEDHGVLQGITGGSRQSWAFVLTFVGIEIKCREIMVIRCSSVTQYPNVPVQVASESILLAPTARTLRAPVVCSLSQRLT